MIHLVILGQPRSQQRHRHFQRGEFRGTYDPSKQDKKNFLNIVQEQAPEKPFDCPLCVNINFYFSRPKNHYGTGKNKDALKPSAPKYHTVRPDRDNLSKLTTDALNKIFWRDDSLICMGEVTKMYSENPRTEITIFEIE